MNLSKYTDFGLCVKTKLLQIGKDQKWLEEAVSEKTGLFIDNGYMYKILTGQRRAPRIVAAICEILSVESN
ncbi:MAG: XRE family transcriptional regulator [Clostridia bacterium]|nr:XRE family transcriptional regulator [Clostridia bacterium]MBQ8836464.1 XRE family transcriptional regulator [Clostridia bacterium]